MPGRCASLCCVSATLDGQDRATVATGDVLLNFTVIKQRAGDLLGVAPEDITDGALAELFGLDRVTIWHYRRGSMKPRFETVSSIADALGVTIDEIRLGNPTPPRPPAPSTPKPPAGPKPKTAGE